MAARQASRRALRIIVTSRAKEGSTKVWVRLYRDGGVAGAPPRAGAAGAGFEPTGVTVVSGTDTPGEAGLGGPAG
jgi:hypothetical protein